jgi:hypothetical protein
MIGTNQTEEILDLRRIVISLQKTAVEGLRSMFDPVKSKFCFGLRKSGTRLTRDAISPRDTIVSLMGLHQLEQAGSKSPIRIQTALDAILADMQWVSGIGDLGLLLWMCGRLAPERLTEVSARWDLQECLAHFQDARRGETTALSLFLTGLSCVGLARPEMLVTTMDLATETYKRLRLNQGEEGLFGCCSTRGSLFGRICGEIGTFRDQVHAVYAITKFSEAYGDHRAMHKALDCALALCERQGRLGQWWWRYNSSSGEIVARFPVFSVHQDGMGPMALFAIGEAARCDFTPWIYKGLQWIEENELGIHMQDESANAIWTRIGRKGTRRVWSTMANLVTGREDRESNFGLCSTFECYPRELGWFLYAFANWHDEGVNYNERDGLAAGD